MRTFIAAAIFAIAAKANDLDQALEKIQDPSKIRHEAEEEWEREFGRFMEDVECWWSDRNNGDGICERRTRRELEDQCWQTEGMTWDWDAQECLTREEMDKRQIERCTLDGGQWMPLREGWPHECIMPDNEWQQCILSGGDTFEDGRCMTDAEWQEYRPKKCEEDGGKWMEIQSGWWDCYREGDKWMECAMKGNEFTMYWDDVTGEESCITREQECALRGQTWTTDEWGNSWCEWGEKLAALMKKLEKQPKAKHILSSYVFDVDAKKVEDILEPVKEGDAQGAKMMQDWELEFEAWYVAQQAREEQAFMELAEVAVDAISVDGVTIREKFGNPKDWFMAKQPREAKNIRSILMVEEQPKNVKVTFEGPSEAELNEWLASVQKRVEEIGEKLENIGHDYERKLDDLGEDLENDLEDKVGHDAEQLINEIGDAAKKISDEAKVDWYLMAAKKASQRSAATSDASFYGGAAAGFFSVVALGAMYAACQRKKTVQANEETLL